MNDLTFTWQKLLQFVSPFSWNSFLIWALFHNSSKGVVAFFLLKHRNSACKILSNFSFNLSLDWTLFSVETSTTPSSLELELLRISIWRTGNDVCLDEFGENWKSSSKHRTWRLFLGWKCRGNSWSSFPSVSDGPLLSVDLFFHLACVLPLFEFLFIGSS